MAFNRRLYPPNWRQFSWYIREVRAKGQCECTGECGLHCGGSLWGSQRRRCEERNGQPAKWARGKVMLTVAHLNASGGPCRCNPLCADPDHVKAMCQRCHLRYDRRRHVQKRLQKTPSKGKGESKDVLSGDLFNR